MTHEEARPRGERPGRDERPHDAEPRDTTHGRRRIPLVPILALVVGYGLFVWQFTARRAVESERAAERASHETLVRALRARMVRFAAVPLAEIVRDDMTNGAFDHVREMFRHMALVRGVSSILLVRNDGKILVSNRAAQEGSEFDPDIRDAYRNAIDVTTDEGRDGVLRAIVPIPGVRSNLGMVVLAVSREGVAE
jgi:hypothetical protein